MAQIRGGRPRAERPADEQRQKDKSGGPISRDITPDVSPDVSGGQKPELGTGVGPGQEPAPRDELGDLQLTGGTGTHLSRGKGGEIAGQKGSSDVVAEKAGEEDIAGGRRQAGIEPGAAGPGGVSSRAPQRHEARASSSYKAFLKDLAGVGNFSLEDAECYAVSVLCALEQRLFGTEARDLEAQLPSKLRELLQRCSRHEGAPPRKFHRDEFFRMVAEDLDKEVGDVEHIIRAVFTAVRAQISEGEAEDVAVQLPSDMADLWRRPS